MCISVNNERNDQVTSLPINLTHIHVKKYTIYMHIYIYTHTCVHVCTQVFLTFFFFFFFATAIGNGSVSAQPVCPKWFGSAWAILNRAQITSTPSLPEVSCVNCPSSFPGPQWNISSRFLWNLPSSTCNDSIDKDENWLWLELVSNHLFQNHLRKRKKLA